MTLLDGRLDKSMWTSHSSVTHTWIYTAIYIDSKKQSASLGTDDGTKTDEFSEKFQTAFDPPPLEIFPKFIHFGIVTRP